MTRQYRRAFRPGYGPVTEKLLACLKAAGDRGATLDELVMAVYGDDDGGLEQAERTLCANIWRLRHDLGVTIIREQRFRLAPR